METEKYTEIQANNTHFSNVPVMWEPKEDSAKLLKKFMKIIREKYKTEIDDYWSLHRWSLDNLAEFWEEYWKFTGIIHSKPFHQVLDPNVPMSEPQDWFAGAEMNFAENLLRYRDDHVALIAAGENIETEKITYAEMYEEVKLYAAALKKHGVTKGDRVSCYMSNRKEAVFAMLSTTSLGAIFIGIVPFLGPQVVVSRLNPVNSKILFTVDKYPQNQKQYDMLPKLKEISEGLPSLEKVIVIATKSESKLINISGIRNSCFLDDFLESGKESDGSVPDLVFQQVPFSHPVLISYTSGTTGAPKALIHGSACILSTSRNLWLCCDSGRQDTWLRVSTVGWIAWNVTITLLFFGVTVVLFEGWPCFLSPTFLWDMVDELKITNLFLPPSVLDDLEKKDYVPGYKNHLNSLRSIISSGSIVKPRNYDFVYKKIKKDAIFYSVYGCTELMGMCTNHYQTLRIYRGESAAPALGIDLECLDDEGNAVTGEIGNVVIAKPHPTLPVGIWNDTDNSVLKETYFNKYPGKFYLGDLGIVNPSTKGYIFCGRSDETLVQKGRRIGSSEIYSVVCTFPEILDSLCVSQYGKNNDERAVLFLKMKTGHTLNEELVERIRSDLTTELSSYYVPEVILKAEDIPYNMNGKKMEIIVKKIINKRPFNPGSVINPECLEYFKDIPELQGF